MKGRVSDWSSAWLLQAPPPPGLQHCCSLPLSAAATTPPAASIILSSDIFMSLHNSPHISDIYPSAELTISKYFGGKR